MNPYKKLHEWNFQPKFFCLVSVLLWVNVKKNFFQKYHFLVEKSSFKSTDPKKIVVQIFHKKPKNVKVSSFCPYFPLINSKSFFKSSNKFLRTKKNYYVKNKIGRSLKIATKGHIPKIKKILYPTSGFIQNNEANRIRWS